MSLSVMIPTLNEYCDSALGCIYTIHDCDDDDACTNDYCNCDDGCYHEYIDCDDGSLCTEESCHPATGCQYTPVCCYDGSACTIDYCESKEGCLNESVNIDDYNACTDDSCDVITLVLNTYLQTVMITMPALGIIVTQKLVVNVKEKVTLRSTSALEISPP